MQKPRRGVDNIRMLIVQALKDWEKQCLRVFHRLIRKHKGRVATLKVDLVYRPTRLAISLDFRVAFGPEYPNDRSGTRPQYCYLSDALPQLEYREVPQCWRRQKRKQKHANLDAEKE